MQRVAKLLGAQAKGLYSSVVILSREDGEGSS